ncbi:PhoH family protein [Halopseudomonas aestusnigri]|jgi:PhoH-like ATPase|uniref:PhoH-like ATPase n=1 Tax=Halopseudomonas aestusnigri TaxID=857252 RepID=A0AAQ1G4S1_9GAMM|nr:PhoH family protein [Halopseudomonas aestusnigri]MAP77216.1 ribonuclease [Pseudomonadales bacterium]MEE2798910.1 PhoH family protein [Pseudomonadota bacterium]MAY07411.1 ribonuclease [Pseudomonadales bacterium]MCC4261290.1 PhoH family protein [Halopseudomonas aestusnigri]MDL2200197.1 PhoH family protein [Halopseudomonas aestusnigri]|tara:strand:+ start:20595 stop:21977 length:1383 start_codon:yes stop_codon:yes gene_type:complete
MEACGPTEHTFYVLDTNVLIHDPNALLNFEEHHVIIPMTVLEELDKLKSGKSSTAADCRQAIRLIDKTLGDAPPDQVEQGVAIERGKLGPNGTLAILMDKAPIPAHCLPNDLNDNKIINQLCQLQSQHPDDRIVLVSKDINMRLKARACGIDAEDYHTDQLLDDIALLARGYHEIEGSFWERVAKVETRQLTGQTVHQVQLTDNLPALHINDFIIDDQGFIGWVKGIDGSNLTIRDLHQEPMLHQECWGLRPRDIFQALAMYALMDPDIHLVNLTGAAGSGKTILALAAAIEQTMVTKTYRRIIATRSTQGLDEDIGFLPGTEKEKMEPWLGAITDNLEALHMDDESTHGSVEYILDRVPLQFKSLNYIRGRSFQQSFILIDESQNLTPHQIKTIITRAGNGSKVICLGNLAQIDTPYLNATSSGLTYLTECFKDFPHGVHIHLQGVPRSALAEYAETHL